MLAILAAPVRGSEGDQKLTVCTVNHPPFFAPSEVGGNGLEHAILSGFAASRGLRMEVRWLDRDNILGVHRDFERLESGECDVLALTLTKTPEREELVDFSDAYFPTRTVLVGPKGEVWSGLESLAGRRVATIRGVLGEELVRRHPSIRHVGAGGERELWELVAAGQADALITDSWVAATLLEGFPDFRVGAALTEVQHFGFALQKDSPLTPHLDRHLRELKESGAYATLLESLLGRADSVLILEMMGL